MRSPSASGPEQTPADFRVVFGHQAAGMLVEHDKARRVGLGDLCMAVVNAVGSAGVKEVAVQQQGAATDVVQNYPQFGDEIVLPQDVAVGRLQFGVRDVCDAHVSQFVQEGPVIAVGLAFAVQAENFAPAADHINAVALHHRAGTDAAIPLVKVIGRFDSREVARDGQPPDQLARGLLDAHHDASAGGFAARPFKAGIVCRDEEAAPVNGRNRILVRARPDFPQRFRVAWIGGQIPGGRDHVGAGSAPPAE